MIAVRAEGRGTNRDGVGVRLTLETDRRKLVREIASGSGFLSQRPRQAEFGLADGETPRRLIAAFPGGERMVYDELPEPDGRWLVIEKDARIRRVEARSAPERRVPSRRRPRPDRACDWRRPFPRRSWSSNHWTALGAPSRPPMGGRHWSISGRRGARRAAAR
jgi:hypothetical protein